MLRTIEIGKYLSVQGLLVRVLANGRIVVRDGNKVYEGMPVTPVTRPRAA